MYITLVIAADYHEMFLRGRPDLLKKLTRTRVKGNRIKDAPSPETEPNFYMQYLPCLDVKPSECSNPSLEPSCCGTGEANSSFEYDLLATRGQQTQQEYKNSDLIPLLQPEEVQDSVQSNDHMYHHSHRTEIWSQMSQSSCQLNWQQVLGSLRPPQEDVGLSPLRTPSNSMLLDERRDDISVMAEKEDHSQQEVGSFHLDIMDYDPLFLL